MQVSGTLMINVYLFINFYRILLSSLSFNHFMPLFCQAFSLRPCLSQPLPRFKGSIPVARPVDVQILSLEIEDAFKNVRMVRIGKQNLKHFALSQGLSSLTKLIAPLQQVLQVDYLLHTGYVMNLLRPAIVSYISEIGIFLSLCCCSPLRFCSNL